MERLDTQNPIENGYLEAAIHMGRYASAAGFVENKRVLDLACGEGFGSYFLSSFGPKKITAVDISAEAISKAKKLFIGPNLEFLEADARNISLTLEPSSFDVVVSYETFEHIENPRDYLLEIKKVLAPGGIVIISCPNDNWYYPDLSASNPFHVKKYTYLEFKMATEEVFGKATFWLNGTPSIGFQNVQVFPPIENKNLGGSWIQVQKSDSYLVKVEYDAEYQDLTPSYWLGLWGVEDVGASGAVASISMDLLAKFFETHASWNDRNGSYVEIRNELAHTRLLLEIAREENRLLRNLQLQVKQQGRRKNQAIVGPIEALAPLVKRVVPTRFHEALYKAASRILKL